MIFAAIANLAIILAILFVLILAGAALVGSIMFAAEWVIDCFSVKIADPDKRMDEHAELHTRQSDFQDGWPQTR